MEPIILNVDSLPLPIRGKFSVKKVSVKEDKGNIILAPVIENKAADILNLFGTVDYDETYDYKKARQRD